MTRAEILNCLTDRPCDSCKFHESGRCERWDCVFEEKPDDAEGCEDKRMTREEAIAKLKNFADHCYPNEEFLMAIKALSAEPCEDCISRQAVLSYIEFILTHGMGKKKSFEFIKKYVEKQPSVTPKQKMGHWKVASDGYGDNAYICECSECKDTVWVYKDADRKWNYCPNCGAKMAESEG